MNARVLRKWSPNTKLMSLMRRWWSWWWLVMVTMLLLTVCAPLATAFQQQQQKQNTTTTTTTTPVINHTFWPNLILKRSTLHNNKLSAKNFHLNNWRQEEQQPQQQLQQFQTTTTTITDHVAAGVVEDSYYIPVESQADSRTDNYHQMIQKQSINRLISSSSENISNKRTSYNNSSNNLSSSKRLSKSQENISRQNNFNNNKMSSYKNISDNILIKSNSDNWSWPSYLMNSRSRKLNLTNDDQLEKFHIDMNHENNDDVEADEQEYQHVEDSDEHDDDDDINDDDENEHFDDDFLNISDNVHDLNIQNQNSMTKNAYFANISQKSILQSQQPQQPQQQEQLMHKSPSDIMNMRSFKSRRHIAETSTLAPLRYVIESFEIPATLPYVGEEKKQNQQQEFESENSEQQAARNRRESRGFVGSVGGMSGIGLPTSGLTNFYNRPPALSPNQQQQPQLPISDFNNNYNYFHKQFSQQQFNQHQQQQQQQQQQQTSTQIQHRFPNYQHIQHQQHQPYYHQHQRFFPTQQQQSTYGAKIVKQPISQTLPAPKPSIPILLPPIIPPPVVPQITPHLPSPQQQPAIEQEKEHTQTHVNPHQHHHQHHHHHKHHQHHHQQEQLETQHIPPKHIEVEKETSQSNFPARRPNLFPQIFMPEQPPSQQQPTHHRNRQQQHRKHHHPRRYCSARDPAQLAYEAPTVFEGRIVSMTPDRRANFSATVEVKEVYKQQVGSYRLQKYLRLQFAYRNTTSECDIYREQLRQRGLVRGDELEQGRIYLMFVHQVDLGNFTILGQPMKKTRRVVEAVKEAVSENYAQLAKIRSITATNRTVENGKELRIVCRVQGRPPPKVTWFKDHKSINRNRKLYQFVHLKKRSELIIRSFNSSDAGRYECRAKNKVDSSLERRAIVIKAYPVPRYETNLTGGTGNNCPADASEFCFNGGTCKFFAEIASYSCICPEGFVGERCDRKEVNNPPSTYSNEQECGEKKFLGSYYC